LGAPDLQKLIEVKLRAAAVEEAKILSLQLDTTLAIAQKRLGQRANFGKNFKIY